MSFFSEELTRVIKEEFAGHQLSLCRKAGISQSILSRQCAGICMPDPSTLEKILEAISPKNQGGLLKAFLIDQCPVSYRSKFKVTPNSDKTNGEGPGASQVDLSDLTPGVRKSVLTLIQHARKNPNAAEFFGATAHFLDPH